MCSGVIFTSSGGVTLYVIHASKVWLKALLLVYKYSVAPHHLHRNHLKQIPKNELCPRPFRASKRIHHCSKLHMPKVKGLWVIQEKCFLRFKSFKMLERVTNLFKPWLKMRVTVGSSKVSSYKNPFNQSTKAWAWNTASQKLSDKLIVSNWTLTQQKHAASYWLLKFTSSYWLMKLYTSKY